MSNEVELPRPNKRPRADPDQVRIFQEIILEAIKGASKSPAKIVQKAPLAPELITILTEWAHRYGYVLHYKEKKKWFDDVPGDIRHEGRHAKVYTIELYWLA
jgi:hypothetical protein